MGTAPGTPCPAHEDKRLTHRHKYLDPIVTTSESPNLYSMGMKTCPGTQKSQGQFLQHPPKHHVYDGNKRGELPLLP
jgi:hypothetical protein